MKKITLKMAVAAAERVALKMGVEHVYHNPNALQEECWNIHTVEGVRTPGCIVGHIVVDEGWLPLEKCPIYGGVGSSVREALEERGIVMTPKALGFLQSVQFYQDVKVEWGTAILRAKRDQGLI